MKTLKKLHFELLSYSPELTPTDFYLKKCSDRNLETQIYFADRDKSAYKKGIEMLGKVRSSWKLNFVKKLVTLQMMKQGNIGVETKSKPNRIKMPWIWKKQKTTCYLECHKIDKKRILKSENVWSNTIPRRFKQNLYYT